MSETCESGGSDSDHVFVHRKVKTTVAHKGQCNKKWFAANKTDQMQTKKIVCKQKRSDVNKKQNLSQCKQKR